MNEELSPPGPLAPGGLRVTALGGINEIGRNMTVFEHLGRLLVIDCGVLFPTHDEPAVDLILHRTSEQSLVRLPGEVVVRASTPVRGRGAADAAASAPGAPSDAEAVIA